MIVVEDLVKIYGDGTRALNGITFAYEKMGSVLAIIGPNGAGKTTLMRILGTQLMPTKGRALVLGYDVIRDANYIRKHISFLPQDIRPHLYSITAYRSIFTYLLMRGYSVKNAKLRAKEIIEELGINDYMDKIMGKLSGGMVKRVLLAMALAPEVDVYFLDEPTSNLDPYARILAWNLINRITKEGALVVLSSHYTEEIANFSDYVMVLDKGKLMAKGRVSELISRRFKGYDVKLLIKSRSSMILKLMDVQSMKIVSIGNSTIAYTNRLKLELILHHLLGKKLKFEILPITLEDVVISIVAGGGSER